MHQTASPQVMIAGPERDGFARAISVTLTVSVVFGGQRGFGG